MDERISDKIVVIPKPDYISWESITDLLHLAYKERSDEGLHYGASTQSVEKTIERVGNGICFVALKGGDLIGTASLIIFNDKGRQNGYFIQNGVHPNYKRLGIGSKLRDASIDFAKLNNFQAVYCDTAIQARSVVNWYLKAGWQKVAYCSHRDTNYYSVQFRLAIEGRKYSKVEAKIRFVISCILCKSIKKENGEFTKFGVILRRILRK